MYIELLNAVELLVFFQSFLYHVSSWSMNAAERKADPETEWSVMLHRSHSAGVRELRIWRAQPDSSRKSFLHRFAEIIFDHTVDGRNPAPVDRWFIQLSYYLYIGFQPSKVVQDFFHPQYVRHMFAICPDLVHSPFLPQVGDKFLPARPPKPDTELFLKGQLCTDGPTVATRCALTVSFGAHLETNKHQ